MSAKRMDMHRLQELVRLDRMGEGIRQISRRMKMGRNTIRRYLAALETAGLREGTQDDLPSLEELNSALEHHLPTRDIGTQLSSLEGDRAFIESLIKKGVGPTAIYDRLRVMDADFAGSLSSVKRLCIRIKKESGPSPDDVVIRVESDPGEEAQVDFGYVGKRYDPSTGTLRKCWVFVMTLCYSRHMVAYLTFDQKIETWLECHVRAFRDLGGVPRVIVPDNLKAAVIRAAFGHSDDPTLNRSYCELARHHGFKIDPTPPRSPEKKGKVESDVGYIKGNFFAGRDSTDIEEDRRDLAIWLREIAAKRRHGTTGRKPGEVFLEEEKSYLLDLPIDPYQLTVWKCVRVHRDCHIQVGGAFYSVPWKHLGQQLWARCTPYSISVYSDEALLVTHRRVRRGARATNENHLPEHRAPLRHRSRSFWESRARQIGPQSYLLVKKVFDSDDVLSKLRAVQAIVTHLEKHPSTRAEAASRRAIHFGSLTYVAIKNILRLALDFEALPGESEERNWAKKSRFARGAADSITTTQETSFGENG